MITTTVVGQSPDLQSPDLQSPHSRAGQDEAGAARTTPGQATPAPGQRGDTPPPGVMIGGFERQYVPRQSDMTFDDLVTDANPLRHIPMVGTFYRAAIGTQLKARFQILNAYDRLVQAYGGLTG